MPVRDTNTIDWLPANLDNSPGDGEYISSDLAPQFRNIKSAYRTLSKSKGQERLNPEQVITPSEGLGITVFNLAGNLLNEFQPNRKILARRPTGQIAPGAVISAEYFYQNSPYTQVVAKMWDGGTGNWTVDHSEIMIGIDRESPEVFPFVMLGGCLSIKDDNDGQTVYFTEEKDGTDSATTPYTIDRRVILPTKTYMVHLTPCFLDADEDSTATVIKKVVKYYDKFKVYLHSSPGSEPGDGKKVIFDWFITRPMENL